MGAVAEIDLAPRNSLCLLTEVVALVGLHLPPALLARADEVIG